MIEVKIFGCYQLTYKPVIKDILLHIYGDSINYSDVIITIEDISDNGTRTIQSQRSLKEYVTRTVRIYENGVLKHIVGMSNTNYDEDKNNEFLLGKSIKNKNSYGELSYHANTYLVQGIPDIFNYYFANKSTSDLSFYLLDSGKSYVSNLFNIQTYRSLQTIGFRILNIEIVDFKEYNIRCHSSLNGNNLAYPSLNKFLNDIAYISSKNSGNTPSFMRCEEVEEENEETGSSFVVEKYIYTMKALSAQVYDSLIRCWCLNVLAEKEGVSIDFKIGKQYFAFNAEKRRVSDKLTQPVKDVLRNAGFNINFVTDQEFLNEQKKEDSAYLSHKRDNNPRNQGLFRNNIRKKGIPTVCSVCGEDNARILDAAHLWEVNQIRDASAKEVNEFIVKNNLSTIIDNNSEHYNELFFKKYSLTNSGDNGIWLCKNHHGLFDSNCFCFDSDDGKIVLRFKNADEAREFANTIMKDCCLDENVLTTETKAFLSKREAFFTANDRQSTLYFPHKEPEQFLAVAEEDQCSQYGQNK